MQRKLPAISSFAGLPAFADSDEDADSAGAGDMLSTMSSELQDAGPSPLNAGKKLPPHIRVRALSLASA